MSKKKNSDEHNHDEHHQKEHQETTLEHKSVDQVVGVDPLVSCQEKLVRIQADFDNFKKRLNKERSLWIEQAQSDLLREVLDFADDFDRAIQAKKTTNDTQEKEDPWFNGLLLAHKNLYDMLKKMHVEPVDCSGSFNPQFHNALAEVPSDKHKTGQIVEVVSPGYLLKGSLLRHAEVTVAK